VEWAQVVTIIASLTAVLGLVVGLQTFWVARELDAVRSEMRRGFDRVDARLDRLEGQGPPGLRRL
jgi:hypothetical protein